VSKRNTARSSASEEKKTKVKKEKRGRGRRETFDDHPNIPFASTKIEREGGRGGQRESLSPSRRSTPWRGKEKKKGADYKKKARKKKGKAK